MNAQNLADDFVQLLKDNAVEAGRELSSDLTAVSDYAAARLAHLSTVVREPGFREALLAERDNVALKAAGRAVDRADSFDAKLLGLIEGSLSLGARALAAAIPG